MRRRTVSVVGVVALVACSGGDGTPTLGEVVEVGSTQHTPYNLSIAAGGDTVGVAWNDYDDVAAVEAPFVVTSTDGGETFGEPVAVDPTDPYVAYPQLAVTSSGVMYAGVTLYEENEGDGRAGLYRSTDQGRTFELVADLDDAPRVAFTAVGTTIAASPDGDVVVMAWSSPGTDEVPGALVAVLSTDGGETFGEPVELAAEVGAGRPRAYADADGAGVIAIVRTPIPDAPAPTPAEPNPVTSTAGVNRYPVTGSGFGPAEPMTGDDALTADDGPAAGGSDVAWWSVTGEGAFMLRSTNGSADRDVLSEPLALTAPVEAVAGADATWILTIAVPDPEGVQPAPLVLARATEDEIAVIDGFAPPVTRSGEEYDLAVVDDDDAMVAWFDDGRVVAQRITT